MKIILSIFCIIIGSSSISISQQFTLVNQEAGIDHIFRQNGFIGGGAAFFDADNDGDDDLYVNSGSDMDRFYLNNGDGSFEDQTIEAGFSLTISSYTTAVAVGDINNDGYQDLFICTRGDSYQAFTKNYLYMNLKDGRFEDVWSQISPDDLAYSTGATFIDYNHDGLLDVYVLNYIDEGAFINDSITGEIVAYNHSCFDNLLYKNIDGLNFERQTEIDIADGGCSLAAVASDVDLDKDLDLLVVNDFGEFVVPNKLYSSNNNESFTEVSASLGLNQDIYGMGIANGDYDNDGDIDYYITNFGGNLLLENNDGQYSNVAISTGCDDTWFSEDEFLSISWGCVFADFDNDKYQDLYVANGWVPSPPFIPSALGQDDVLFMNKNGDSFERSVTSGISNINVSRGVVYSDYDNDGDIDLFVVSQSVPANATGWSSKLFRNDTQDLGNYLQVQLIGGVDNTNAYGSRVEIFSNGQSFIREHISSSSYASQNSAVLHFGLDTLSTIDSLRVDWMPENYKDTCFYNLEINQKLVITRDSIFESTDYFESLVDTMTIDTMTIDTMMTDTMQVDTTSSLYTYVNDNELINIYPNPSEEKLFVDLDHRLSNCKFEIFSLNGNSFEVNIQNDKAIDIGFLPEGIYFFSFKCQDQVFSKRFIKTN